MNKVERIGMAMIGAGMVCALAALNLLAWTSDDTGFKIATVGLTLLVVGVVLGAIGESLGL